MSNVVKVKDFTYKDLKTYTNKRSCDGSWETLKSSVVLKFVNGLLKRYKGKTDYNIYITKEWLLEIKQALERLEAIDNSNPSEALEELEKVIEEITISNADLRNILKTSVLIATIKQALIKAQELKNENDELETKCLNLVSDVVRLEDKVKEQDKVLDDKLSFKDGSITCGFDYKEKQIVAMPLVEYNRLMEQEKVLKIIFEKNVNTLLLELAENVEEYNERIVPNGQLTYEEFELLKRYLERKGD